MKLKAINSERCALSGSMHGRNKGKKEFVVCTVLTVHLFVEQKPNSGLYNFVEVSGLEVSVYNVYIKNQL